MNTFKNKSQLTNKQHEYVSEVAKLVDRPFPTHLSEEIILPISHSEDGFQLESDIENMQQFYIWFESLEGKIEEKELEKFSMFFDRTKVYEEICEQLLEEIDQSISSLDSLEEEYNLVSTKTGQLHEACEELLKQQQQLIKFATLIETKLGYFNDLDIITNQFNNPSLSVLDDSFMRSLNRLSDCTNFISENPNFLESKNYLMRFKQLQSRGLSMIKNFIVASLRSTFKGGMGEGGGGSGGINNNNGGNINFDNSQIYTKFKTIAPKIRPLCKEIESRISIREYQALLIDCHYCYTQQRKLLLSPFIVAHTRSLSLLPDLSTMIRTGCNYLIKLCQIEFDLFHLFFVTFSANLRSLLEEIGEEIYESLRPLFIRSQEIDVLSNAAHILKTEILEYSILNKGESVQSIQPIINRMLEDIQERLIFLSQRFILESISTFEPTFEQINYPTKLLSSSSSSSPENGIKTIYESWYPTLERTLLFLSKLFLSIDPKIFEGLAQETVSECSLSLIRASKIIEKRTGYLHSQLFLIRHLLILREQITPFEIEFCIVEKKLDFSSMREVFSDVFRGKFAWRSPRVVESQLDSKKDLEKAITESIEIFIRKIISPTTDPLSSFLSTALAFVNVQMNNNNNNSPLREQSFARPRLVKEIVSGVVNSFKPKLQMSVIQPIKLYFHNTPNNEERMFHYIRDFILKDFTTLHNLIEKHYTEQDKAEINFNLHHVAELIDFKNWPHVGAEENAQNIIGSEQSI